MKYKEMGKNMKKIQPGNWYRSIILRQISIFLFILITCTSIFLGIYHAFQTETIGKTRQLMQERDKQAFTEIDNRLSELEFNLYELFESRDVNLLSVLWDYYDSKTRAEKIDRVQDQLKWISAKDRFLSTMRLYLRNNGVFIAPREYDTYSKEAEAQFGKYLDEAQTAVMNGETVYVYIRQLPVNARMELPDFFCELQIQKRYFDTILDALQEEDAQGMILVGDEILASSVEQVDVRDALADSYRAMPKEELSFTFDRETGADRYLCSAVTLERYPITLLTVRTEESVFGAMVTILRIAPLVFVMDLIVMLLFCLYMNRFVRQKVELDRAQMKQLQAQIDPHFLYNTLFMLRTRAKKKDDEGVERLAGLMGEYFQFLNRDKRDFVTLESELRHACVYAEIQANRFAERFMFQGISCPEEYKNVSVPRLILQPLVENAIKYQAEMTEEKGMLCLNLEEQDGKLLVVIESSLKVDAEKVQELNRYVAGDAQQGEVTSTMNIMRRLQLYYGKSYRLYYESGKYAGLRTVVELDAGRRIE